MSDLRPNRALIAARRAKGWSQLQLAAHLRELGPQLGVKNPPELQSVIKQISRLERGQTTRPGGDFYLPALCAALDVAAPELFGEATAPAVHDGACWSVSSRKYIPVYLGPDAATKLGQHPALSERTCEWLVAQSFDLPWSSGTCTLTLFEFGVVVAEIVEELTFTSVAEFAVWRKKSYRAAREQVSVVLCEQWPMLEDVVPSYVLSTYQLLDPLWQGEELQTAMRLLCVPGVLLERHVGDPCEQVIARAEVAERVCFRDGFNRPDIENFGIEGVSIGYASWSGVSYLAQSPARAINADELGSFQTVVQALWCYTNTIAEVVEAGEDPVVPDAYGWRFLRACLSRLTSARPRETGQERMMRDAILNTSRLTTQLVDAHAILRDLASLAGRR